MYNGFPLAILDKNYIEKSVKTDKYNCIAWSLGIDTKWYWPSTERPNEWLDHLPFENNIPNFIRFYNYFGYEVCDTHVLEEGYDKVAIYVRLKVKVTHAAKQITTNKWASKIGRFEDIHHTLGAIENLIYGEVSFFMKKKIN